jgi:hypothetical protein
MYAKYVKFTHKTSKTLDVLVEFYLPMFGGSLQVLWLLPPLKLVAMI